MENEVVPRQANDEWLAHPVNSSAQYVSWPCGLREAFESKMY